MDADLRASAREPREPQDLKRTFAGGGGGAHRLRANLPKVRFYAVRSSFEGRIAEAGFNDCLLTYGPGASKLSRN